MADGTAVAPSRFGEPGDSSPESSGRAGSGRAEGSCPEPCDHSRPMHSLLILSRRAADYHRLVGAAQLPELAITSTTDAVEAGARAGDYDMMLGEPSLFRQVLPDMTALRWAQATWAGVEPLLDPSLRRDYVLTNARGVFGALMSEYVFGDLLAR